MDRRGGHEHALGAQTRIHTAFHVENGFRKVNRLIANAVFVICRREKIMGSEILNNVGGGEATSDQKLGSSKRGKWEIVKSVAKAVGGAKTVKADKGAGEAPVSGPQREVKFLSDRPLAAEEEQADRFGHSGIAENLKQIVLVCPVPFTIGLFGKWGTGKTSILNILKAKLATDNKVPVVIFDVWKHEGDALRRTFLKEIVEQLQHQNLLKKFELSERVAKSISIKKTVEKIDRLTLGVFLGLVATMIIIGLFLWQDKSLFNPYFSVATSGSLVTILLIWLFKRIIVTENITSKADRFEDPHEFEREFFRIIKEAHAHRLLIAVDNLDRCTHENAVKLLTTIKTFLAKDSDTETSNNCIFLIPCDDGAIKKHLESVYSKDQTFNSDEFLRKFFNTFLVIPDFIDTELQNYTEQLLRETNIPEFDSADLASVINTAFHDNPREIKQFINILISHFLMGHNREGGEDPMIVPEGAITDNIPFLAKFMAMRQKFPEQYKDVVWKSLAPEEWGNLGDTDFKSFHNATSMFTVSDIRPFIYLKQSKEEREIPGLREIERGLIENNEGVVTEGLKGVGGESDKLGHFNVFLLNLLRRYQNAKATLINIISCASSVARNLELGLPDRFYKRIGHLLKDPAGLKWSLYHFEPGLIFTEVLTRCEEDDRNEVVAEYVAYLACARHEKDTVRIEPAPRGAKTLIGRNYAYMLLTEFVKKKVWLTEAQKGQIRLSIQNSYASDLEIMSLFQSGAENQKDFVSEKTVSNFTLSFSDDDVADIASIAGKVALLLKFKEIITPTVTGTILGKFQELLKHENTLPLEATEGDEVGRKENFARVVENVLFTLRDGLEDAKLKAKLTGFGTQLNQGLDVLEDWNDSKMLIPSSLLIIDLVDDPPRSTLSQIVETFFGNAELGSIKCVFENEKLDKKEKAKVIDRYEAVFKERAMEQSILDYLYPMASKETRTGWLVALINSYPEMAIQKLQSEEYKTDDDKKIVGTLLNKAAGVAVQEKSRMYSAINKMSCAKDTSLKATLITQIKSLLKTVDQQTQEVGYNALDGTCPYLTNASRREIATEVIDWLRSPELGERYQPYSIKSIILSWGLLAKPARDDYIYFVFHNLIMPKTNSDAISLGFEVLSKIGIVYEEDTKTYFDDTLSTIEDETSKDVLNTMLNGLILVKPKKPSGESKAFWTKVAKLQDRREEENKA